MAIASSARFAAGIAGAFTFAGGGAAAAQAVQVSAGVNTTYAAGTAAGQANFIYTQTRTVASSSSADVIDLSALTNPDGGTLALSAVLSYAFQPVGTNALFVGGLTNGVTWLPRGTNAGAALSTGSDASATGGASSNAFLSCNCPDGFVVTPGTGDRIQVGIASGTNVQYNVTILGR